MLLPQLQSYISGLVFFVVYVILFLFFMQLRPKTGWLGVQIVVAGIILISGSIYLILNGTEFMFWYVLGIFGVCWFLFFLLSTAVYVSVSARILRMIYRNPAHSMPVDEIYKTCIYFPFFERVKFFIDSGFVQKGTGGYRITKAGQTNANRINTLRHILGMEGTGLYSVMEISNTQNKGGENMP